MNFAASFLKSSRSSTRKANALRTRERGWALVSVLWALAILSMMAAATEALTVSTARIAHRAYDAARIDADIHAAVVRAVLAIDDPRVNARWRVDGIPQKFAFDGLTMAIAVQDAAGLIDLNVADQDNIAGLFTSAGLTPDTAQTLAINISDWRTPIDSDDDPSRKQGTTDKLYANAGYKPRHNPFQTIDELKLVAGMTPALFARVAPALTVYSRDSDVDEETAPLVVLNALYPGNANKVTQTLQARETPQPSSDGSSQPAGPPGVVSSSGTSWGHSYRVTIAAAPDGRHILHSAVVEPTGDPDRPFLVEAWN
jgi:general secretion pathway protein K